MEHTTLAMEATLQSSPPFCSHAYPMISLASMEVRQQISGPGEAFIFYELLLRDKFYKTRTRCMTSIYDSWWVFSRSAASSAGSLAMFFMSPFVGQSSDI